jgi:serine/threonine-protein kinase
MTSFGGELPLQSWDRYKITGFLGAGGMGAVYKAQDLRLKRIVAIKFLRTNPGEPDEPRQRKRFEREARAQARIEHPHICKIYEVGEVEGQPYIAMHFIDGAPLPAYADAMSREEKVRVIKEVAEALHAAHVEGVIHRDLKPANVMIERRADGTFWPYLMDFGLAREMDGASMTTVGGVEGTPGFMAPEQVRGETQKLDRRTDVYGLGAALYALLGGRAPFIGSSADILMNVMLDDPPMLRTLEPSVPLDLETIVHKCLEKDPARRFQTAAALAEDLSRFLQGSRIVARPPSIGQRLDKFVRRHRLLVVSVATALGATLTLGGVALRTRIQAAEQARLAQQLAQEIKDMEWLLRSARQMPLHDLDYEKSIIGRVPIVV